jgi:hypothetical protein
MVKPRAARADADDDDGDYSRADIPRTARSRALLHTAVLALAATVVVADALVDPGPRLDGTLVAVAIALCAAGNLFEVFAPASFSFQPNLVIFLGASLLLPPWAIVILAVVSFLPGWIVNRFRWYMVVFNTANYVQVDQEIAAAKAECAALLAKIDPTRASWSRASWSRASWSTSFDK